MFLFRETLSSLLFYGPYPFFPTKKAKAPKRGIGFSMDLFFQKG